MTWVRIVKLIQSNKLTKEQKQQNIDKYVGKRGRYIREHFNNDGYPHIILIDGDECCFRRDEFEYLTSEFEVIDKIKYLYRKHKFSAERGWGVT